jgi:hypothetical protein
MQNLLASFDYPVALPAPLDLDFGEVGWRDRHRFAVQLDATPLLDLIRSAVVGSRAYELVTIQRIADLWAYVDVLAVALPPDAQTQWDQACSFLAPKAQRVPFEDFDAFFVLLGDDTEPSASAWRHHWYGDATARFASSLMGQVRLAVERLPELDLLMTHELKQARSGLHAYEAWTRAAILRQSRSWYRPPAPPVHTQAFYAKVEQLLQRPEVESVAYRADGDYAVMRLMCVEQRRRADAQGKPVGEALHLSSACNRTIDNAAWGSELHMYDEGIGWGDLWIEGFGDLGAPVPRLLGTDWQKFGHTVLSAKDLGELRGYGSERGDGWVLYEALPGTSVPRPGRESW